MAWYTAPLVFCATRGLWHFTRYKLFLGKFLHTDVQHFKGTLSPLLGIGICVSIQFGAFEATKRFFSQQNILRGEGGPDGKLLSPPQLVLAGSLAGLANSVVSGPVEHIRIRE